MPVYNAENYIEEAIYSILNQTFSNFELIILEDASEDNSLSLIKKFKDPRIRLIANRDNLGIVKNLNHGLTLSTGKYIVRMDADDVSYPDRIEKQVEFMEANPQVNISGTWFRIMHNKEIIKHPVNHQEIVFKLFSDTAFGHPTVILRSSFIKENNIVYPNNLAEDYALWVSLIQKAYFANIPEVLLDYRWHGKNLSGSQSLIDEAETISLSMLEYAIEKPSLEEKKIYLKLFKGKGNTSNNQIKKLIEIILSNSKNYNIEEKFLKNALYDRLHEMRVLEQNNSSILLKILRKTKHVLKHRKL